MSSEQALRESILQLVSVAEFSIQQRALLPALVLIYAGIDTMGWLTAEEPGVQVRARFTAWVDRYMLPEQALGCTSIDLYAARCGMLHTLTADSDLSSAGQARPIFYAWGKVTDAQHDAVASAAPDRFAFVRLEALLASFRLGVAKTIETAVSDPKLAGRMLSRGRRFFVNVPTERLLGGLPPAGAA